MSSRSLQLTDEIYQYILQHSIPHNIHCEALREATTPLEWARMQISPEQGQLMAFLVELIDARKAIEVGVFTGYSSLCVALAMPENGRIVACDISEDWTSIGRKYWKAAGVEDKIDLRLAPALDTLQQLIDSGEAGTYDFAFIDADKENYSRYYELCLQLLRQGGLLLLDNVLWSGRVVDPAVQDIDTEAIRAVNYKAYNDPRVSLSMLPVGDGLTLIRKR